MALTTSLVIIFNSMNEGANLVSESLLGNSFVTVSIGQNVYSVYPPTIKVLCRVVSAFSKIGMEGEYTKTSVLSEIPNNAECIIEGLAALIVGDCKHCKWKTYKVRKILRSATCSELKEAIELALPLLGGDDFFEVAALAKQIAGIAAKPKL